MPLKTISLKGDKSFVLTESDLKKGTNYILIEIPAGNYKLDNVRLSNYYYSTLKDGYWDFEVKPRSINYIGNFNVSVYYFYGLRTNLYLENKSVDALEFMRKNFSDTLERYAIVYASKGEDYFFGAYATMQQGAN